MKFGICRCYIHTTKNIQSNIADFGCGNMVYIFCFNTYPLSNTYTWHGFQVFVDIVRNNIYYRAHEYAILEYKTWKQI